MIKGELFERLKLNKNRLLSELYNNESLFSKSSDWPGDFPGRCILGLCSLYYAFDGYINEQIDILNRLHNIFDVIDNYLNQGHYFGEIFSSDNINEQQLSGNSWYIRGLVKYYKISQDEKILEYIKCITKNFLLPLSYYYNSYPISGRDDLTGGVDGHSYKVKGTNWIVSTDIGCAFILVDGYTNVYKITKDPELKEAIVRIISCFENINFVKLSAQTHATLSFARSILRFYECINDVRYLKFAIKIFNTYLEKGMTLDYQNFNWFNRKDSWTEPCCVVDSFIISKKLYEFTSDTRYLKLMNKIYFNGFRTMQRDNGGAGCSSCLSDINFELKCYMYEAWFCCSMRLAEGLFVASREAQKLLIPNSFANEKFEILFDLYNSNLLNVSPFVDQTIKLYVPDGFRVINCSGARYKIIDNFLVLELLKGVLVSIEYDIDLSNENGCNFLGDMLLTKKENHVSKQYLINENNYSILFDSRKYDEESLKKLVQFIK